MQVPGPDSRRIHYVSRLYNADFDSSSRRTSDFARSEAQLALDGDMPRVGLTPRSHRVIVYEVELPVPAADLRGREEASHASVNLEELRIPVDGTDYVRLSRAEYGSPGNAHHCLLVCHCGKAIIGREDRNTVDLLVQQRDIRVRQEPALGLHHVEGPGLGESWHMHRTKTTSRQASKGVECANL
jgi:hypothetical protein